MKKELKYEKEYNENHQEILSIDISGTKIQYQIEILEDYVGGYIGGSGSTSEYLEEIENEERTTHNLILLGSDWKTVIHGYVKFKVYEETKDNEDGAALYMVFNFTGKGNSMTRTKEGSPHKQRVDLGRIYEESDKIKLVTDDGGEHYFSKN